MLHYIDCLNFYSRFSHHVKPFLYRKNNGKECSFVLEKSSFFYIRTIMFLLCYQYCIFVCRRSTSAFRSWCFRHKFLLMMIVYAFILIIVGLANSKTFRYQLKKFGIFKQRWCLHNYKPSVKTFQNPWQLTGSVIARRNDLSAGLSFEW